MMNLNIKRTSVADRIEDVKPQIAAEKVVVDSPNPVLEPTVQSGMNPILKYSLLGIGGALVIFFGYRMIFKRK